MGLSKLKEFSKKIKNNPVDPAWLRGYAAGFEDATNLFHSPSEITHANDGNHTKPITEAVGRGHNGDTPTESTAPTKCDGKPEGTVDTQIHG